MVVVAPAPKAGAGALAELASTYRHSLGWARSAVCSPTFSFPAAVAAVAVAAVACFPGGSGGNGGGASPKSTPFDFLRVVPDDRTYDDWLRDEERRYQRLGDFGIYYEGYPQYGPAGESIYHYAKKQGGSAQ